MTTQQRDLIAFAIMLAHIEHFTMTLEEDTEHGHIWKREFRTKDFIKAYKEVREQVSALCEEMENDNS